MYPELSGIARQARLLALEMVYQAQSGHLGGSFSIIDAITVLYFHTMHIDPTNPKMPHRDRLVLSKGHATPALYSILALRGFFDASELTHFRQVSHHLSGHAEMRFVSGVDMSTGSLGQGLSVACGMALAAKLQKQTYHIFAILGDGELTEGQIWEAALFANHYQLGNLCALVDVNGLQIDGTTDAVLSTAPLAEKWHSFGWHVQTVDGHDFDALITALDRAKMETEKPSVLLLQTVKGKGVSFMENQVSWHGKAPDSTQYALACQELKEGQYA